VLIGALAEERKRELDSNEECCEKCHASKLISFLYLVNSNVCQL
jgi:hypothetical protein